MILQCPACDARFLVNDALIPKEGREVRCGRCKHAWHVTPSPVPIDVPPAPPQAEEKAPVFASFADALANATPEEADSLAESAASPRQLPAVHAQAFRIAPFLWPTAALAALVVLLAPVAFYPSWKDGPLAGFYAGLGWTPGDGLAFTDVAFSTAPGEGSRTRYMITGNISNHAKQERILQQVRVTLKGSGGEDVWSRTYPVGKALGAGDVFPFDIPEVETAFDERVSTVVLDIGNSYELMVR